ncbi:MAG TPA: TonB-dependent receptor [Methylomirabilota bacterium]|nr:TonB-dependent receptor [Methylomirabilota bacterium]
MSQRQIMGICLSVFLLLCSSAAVAQTSTARITGLVTDASGAVLPGVEVVVQNVATGLSRSLTSNERGRYVAADLPPGPYEITATMAGFDTLVRSGITLAVGDDIVINLGMQVGSITQQVTVTGEAPLVNTTTSGISGVVEERRITDLPLNGRDFGQLALVQPGALDVRTAAAGDSSKGFGTRLSLSGSRPMDTGYSLDGTNVNSVGNFATPGSAAGVVLGVDAVREFRVVTGGGYSAEYGGYSGGVVQMVTKSGTNQFHGTAFGLHRNDNLDANSWENNKTNSEKSEFRRNQFGGSLGGPIKTDRAFFFAAYEGLRQARTGETNISNVLDENARRGILPDGRTVAIAPSIKPYLDLWPLPNGPSNGDGSARRYTPENTVTNENYLVARVDYQLNDRQKVFTRFNFDNAKVSEPGGLGVLDDVTPSRQRFSTIQYENILTPTLLSSSSFAFNRISLNHEIEYTIDYPKNLFFMQHQYAPTFTLNTPGVSFSGGSQPSTRIQNKWELSQAFSFSSGNHTWKFGGSWSYIGFNNSGPAAGAFGSFTWNNLERFLTDGNLDNLTAEVPNADTARTVRQQVYALYFQDDWRVRPNFTLNLGLRYEPWTSPSEKWGRVSTYRDWVTATQFSHPSTDGTDVYFDSPGEKAFSPRIGLAWDVKGDGKTAIRAGVGIFNVMLLSPYLNTVTRKNPPNAGTLLQNNPGVNFAGAANYVLVRTPATLSTTLSPSTFSEAIQFDLDPMYELKFNFSIEREVMRDLSVTLGYVGNRGTHLTMKSDWNARPATLVNGRPFVSASTPRPNPNNGVITGTTSDAKSFYNALNVEVKKRFSAGFQAQMVYTWSKNVDDSTTGLGNSDFSEGLVTQPYNHRADRGLASTHLGQNLVINGLWSLPSPSNTGFASKLLGGWQISGILKASSGVPVGPTLRGSGGSGSAPDGRRSANEQHPELVAGRTVESMTTGTFQGCAATTNPSTGQPLPGYAPGQKLGTPDLYFDPCAFERPLAGFYGNAGRNIIIGPGFLNMDFSLMKSIPLGLAEGSRLQFNADFFNIANRPSFGRPQNATIQNSNGRVFTGAGQITSTVSTARQIQFGLKLIF